MQINKKRLIISITIGIMAGVGDQNAMKNENQLAAAISDNFSHATIGFLTWLHVLIAEPSFKPLSYFIEYFLCGVFSSLIDVDHFIAAKSTSLKDAVSLSHRPFMHCTTGVLSGIIVLLCLAYIWVIPWMYQLGWILIAAVTSHHIRDSNRRGFWLWPFGSTPPTPYLVYLLSQMLLPYGISFLMKQLPLSYDKDFDIDVSIV